MEKPEYFENAIEYLLDTLMIQDVGYSQIPALEVVQTCRGKTDHMTVFHYNGIYYMASVYGFNRYTAEDIKGMMVNGVADCDRWNLRLRGSNISWTYTFANDNITEELSYEEKERRLRQRLRPLPTRFRESFGGT